MAQLEAPIEKVAAEDIAGMIAETLRKRFGSAAVQSYAEAGQGTLSLLDGVVVKLPNGERFHVTVAQAITR